MTDGNPNTATQKPKPPLSSPPPPPHPNAPPPMPGAPVPNHSKAIPALVTGIIAVGCFILFWIGASFGVGFCCPVIGLICGIIALVLGMNARKEIKKEPKRYGGDGYALGGMICGGIAVGLCALEIIAGIIMAIFFTAIIMAYFGVIFAILGCNSGIFSIGIGLGMVVAICSIAKISGATHYTRLSRKK